MPAKILSLMSLSANHTKRIGQRLSLNLFPGAIIALFGELGSGKTTFVKGMAKGLGIDAKSVSSPSFVLIKEFLTGKFPLYHFDFYRLKHAEEIEGLGYEEYLFGSGISVIEWAQRLGKLLPKNYLGVKFFLKDKEKRILKFFSCGKNYDKLLKELRHR